MSIDLGKSSEIYSVRNIDTDFSYVIMSLVRVKENSSTYCHYYNTSVGKRKVRSNLELKLSGRHLPRAPLLSFPLVSGLGGHPPSPLPSAVTWLAPLCPHPERERPGITREGTWQGFRGFFHSVGLADGWWGRRIVFCCSRKQNLDSQVRLSGQYEAGLPPGGKNLVPRDLPQDARRCP